jgi:hypothetical protein
VVFTVSVGDESTCFAAENATLAPRIMVVLAALATSPSVGLCYVHKTIKIQGLEGKIGVKRGLWPIHYSCMQRKHDERSHSFNHHCRSASCCVAWSLLCCRHYHGCSLWLVHDIPCGRCRQRLRRRQSGRVAESAKRGKHNILSTVIHIC